MIQNACSTDGCRTSHSSFTNIAAGITITIYRICTVISVITATIFLLQILRLTDTCMLQFIYIGIADLYTSSASDKASGTSGIRIVGAVFFKSTCNGNGKPFFYRINTGITDHRNKSIDQG